MDIRTPLLFILYTIITSLWVKAQEKEVELWLKAGADYDINKRWGLAIEQQIRFDDKVSEVKNYHTELALKYELFNDLDIMAVGRFVRRNDNQGNIQGYENHFRYQIGTAYKHDIKSFDIQYRLLYQHRNEMGLSESEGDVSRQYLRFRTRLTYKIKDWKYDPQLRVEIFDAWREVKAGIDDSYRIGIGTERDYDKLGEFGLAYVQERTIGVNPGELIHIVSFKYSYSF